MVNTSRDKQGTWLIQDKLRTWLIHMVVQVEINKEHG